MGQAGLPREQQQGSRTAVILGTGVGGITTIDDVCYNEYALKARLNPLAIPRIMGSAAASHISMLYGCTGPTFAVTSACASSAQAIGIGTALLRSGAVDRAIVGGSESSMTAINIRIWELLRVLAPEACRPFSIGRNGMVLGEGAAMLVIEDLQAARSRNAAPLAEIAGYGTTSDAFDIVRPDPEGARSAMQLAIADAGMTPDDIDYVNAHGTGTIANDIAEAEALRRVFGARLPGWRYRRPNRSMATRWAPAEPSNLRSRSWLCATISRRRRSTGSGPTRNAISILSPTKRGRSRSARRCRTRSRSEVSTHV